MEETVTRGTGHDRMERVRESMRPVPGTAYGQSPWDTLEREDLLFLVQSYHAAARSAAAALSRLAAERGLCRFDAKALAMCRAAEASVYSDYPGVTLRDVPAGSVPTPGDFRGSEEGEVHWRATMRGVSGLLAFDLPHWVDWACEACDQVIGISPETQPTSPRMGQCGGGTRCSFRRATWDDWRAEGLRASAAGE